MLKQNKSFRFLDWKVYQDSQALFFKTREIAETLPKQYRYEIGSQIVRSALSVILNLSEGSAKSSKKDVSRFIEIALGSLYETRAALDTIQKDPGLSLVVSDEFFSLMDGIRKQLGGFKKSLQV
jgi:four helix bundle protein